VRAELGRHGTRIQEKNPTCCTERRKTRREVRKIDVPL
jgi:hypothetical protein